MNLQTIVEQIQPGEASDPAPADHLGEGLIPDPPAEVYPPGSVTASATAPSQRRVTRGYAYSNSIVIHDPL